MKMLNYLAGKPYILLFFFSSPGMLQADPGVIRDNHQIFRLFVHETQRVLNQPAFITRS